MIKDFIKSLLYQRQCPICGIRLKRFLPLEPLFADNLRKYTSKYKIEKLETLNPKEYYCPSCKCTDRDRLYAAYLQKINNFKDLHLLDIAPGASLRYFLQKRVKKYRSVDLYRTDVDDQLDICNMHKYSDNMFDFIICSHVLEHVPDDIQAMKEIYRILKPGGEAIVMVPISSEFNDFDEDLTINDEAEQWRRFMQNDHVRMYNREVFFKRWESVKFKINIYSKSFFSSRVYRKLGLTKSSALYVVSK